MGCADGQCNERKREGSEIYSTIQMQWSDTCFEFFLCGLHIHFLARSERTWRYHRFVSCRERLHEFLCFVRGRHCLTQQSSQIAEPAKLKPAAARFSLSWVLAGSCSNEPRGAIKLVQRINEQFSNRRRFRIYSTTQIVIPLPRRTSSSAEFP